MRRLFAIASADDAERMRRFSFLLTIVVTLYIGYIYFPGPNAGYATIIIDGHRGIYDSAYLGSAIAVFTVLYLSLIGFFLVRGSVERDRALDVDGIVCASPTGRLMFLFGKFVSNFALLLAVAGISCVAAVLMQELRGENRHIDVLAYLLPFLAITVPCMALVSALGVAFDVIRPLRGIFGGIVFAVIWNLLMIFPVTLALDHGDRIAPYDALGGAGVVIGLRDAARVEYPKLKLDQIVIGGSALPRRGLSTYAYAGISWTPWLIAQRAMWFLISLLLVAIVSPLFDRFSREVTTAKRSRFDLDLARAIPNVAGLRVFRAEFALLVNGANVWWMLGALGLAIACGVAPLGVVTAYILPVAFIWPLERLSALGSRERHWGVDDILATTRGYVNRTQPIQIAAGTLLGTAICVGYLIRMIATGHSLGALACVLVITATAAVALALGTVSASPRPFEALYLLLWYIGPINHASFVDFSAATLTAPLYLSAIAATVVVVSLLGATASRQARRSA